MILKIKRIEGCSDKTLKYYKATIDAMLDKLKIDIKHIVTEDIRNYLMDYQKRKKLSKVTIDNILRILSSFFSWLEDEDYILKSPVRRIHKVKTACNIKETYSDEALEMMRDNCITFRMLVVILGTADPAFNEARSLPYLTETNSDRFPSFQLEFRFSMNS